MHFTYVEPDASELKQGDLIRRGPAVDRILELVHRHYLKNDYLAFLILTQSCDLVRREGGKCKARYITIAAIRPLKLVLNRQVDMLSRSKLESEFHILDQTRKEKIQQFVERLLNNNEDEYFFLHREPSVAINTDSCAFLQLSIAIKSEEHYETLLNSKALELSEAFQHKLGYLVGKMYSRIGTADWSDHFEAGVFEDKLREIVDNSELATWLDNGVHRGLIKKFSGIPDNQITKEGVLKAAEEILDAKRQRKDEILKAVERVLSDLKFQDEDIARTRKRLVQDPQFNANIR